MRGVVRASRREKPVMRCVAVLLKYGVLGVTFCLWGHAHGRVGQNQEPELSRSV